MTTKHPIDHAIVAVLFLVEGICWLINELAGFHKPEPEVVDPRTIYAVEADFYFYEDDTLDGGSHDLDWEDYTTAFTPLATLTVKELRARAKGLAKGLNKMRKAELIALLA